MTQTTGQSNDTQIKPNTRTHTDPDLGLWVIQLVARLALTAVGWTTPPITATTSVEVACLINPPTTVVKLFLGVICIHRQMHRGSINVDLGLIKGKG